MYYIYIYIFERGLINENIIQKLLNLLTSNSFKNKPSSFIQNNNIKERNDFNVKVILLFSGINDA